MTKNLSFADLIGSRWLEYGFIATPSPADLRQDPFPLMPAELETAYFASPSPADLRRLFYAYY